MCASFANRDTRADRHAGVGRYRRVDLALRGYAQATKRLDALDGLHLSAVSYLELLQGLRNKNELNALKAMLARRSATM
jgi:hypothetical protein